MSGARVRLGAGVRRVVDGVRLQMLGVRMRRKHRRLVREGPLAGHRLLAEFANACPEAFFIEIGANDGTQQDHLGPLILSTRWRGIMVEPQPDAFRRLVSNFGSVERVALENVAISDRDGKLPFYEVEPPKRAGSWELFGSYDLLGSLSREALLEHDWIDDVEHRILRTEVDCLRLETLCRKHSVERCDLLVVDTEGHDYEVLRQLEPSGLRPRVVGYEHALLRAPEREACTGMLRQLGYELLEESFDTWCFDPGIDDELTRTWRALRPTAPPVILREG